MSYSGAEWIVDDVNECTAGELWLLRCKEQKELESRHTYGQTDGGRGTDKGKRVGGVWALTLTGPIRPSQDGALLDLAKGLEQSPDVVLALLLAEHSHKQLPVFWIGREEGVGKGGRVEERREQTNATADGTVLLS